MTAGPLGERASVNDGFGFRKKRATYGFLFPSLLGTAGTFRSDSDKHFPPVLPGSPVQALLSAGGSR